MVNVLSKEEKERVLKTLEEDREFRYAIAGLIGIREVLERLDRMESRMVKHGEVLEKHTRILEEHSKRLEELTRVVGELKVGVGSLGRRIDMDLEKTILNLYKHLLIEKGITDIDRVEKFVYKDIDGKYYVRGAKIEVDVYLHDDKMYLIKVKSYVDIDDVLWFHHKAGIVEKILGRRADKLFIVAVEIDREAYNQARELGIEVVYGSIVED